MNNLLKIAFFLNIFITTFTNTNQHEPCSVDEGSLAEIQQLMGQVIRETITGFPEQDQRRIAEIPQLMEQAIHEVVAARSEQEQREFHEKVSQETHQIEQMSDRELKELMFLNAVGTGDIGMVKMFLDLGIVDIKNVMDRYGLKVLKIAFYLENPDMVTLLRSYL